MGNRSSSKLARALVDNDLQSAEKIYYVNEKAIKPFEFITKNKNDTWYGTTLAHCAALGGNERFLRLFLEKEISQIRTNIEKCNLAKESILHCACGGGIENFIMSSVDKAAISACEKGKKWEVSLPIL